MLQLQEVLHSQVLILMGDFNHLDICWENITGSCKQSRRLLESINDNILVQVLERLTRDEVLLDLVLTSAEEIIKDIKIGGSLGCSDHALVGKEWSQDTELQESELQLFKELLDKISWESVLRDKAGYSLRMPF